jgi:hypothetical protein
MKTLSPVFPHLKTKTDPLSETLYYEKAQNDGQYLTLCSLLDEAICQISFVAYVLCKSVLLAIGSMHKMEIAAASDR